MPGIAGRQVSLQEHETVISGLLNSRGEKVRAGLGGQCTTWPAPHAGCSAGSLPLRDVCRRDVPDSLSAAGQWGCLWGR